jgi:hypothetical protein
MAVAGLQTGAAFILADTVPINVISIIAKTVVESTKFLTFIFDCIGVDMFIM